MELVFLLNLSIKTLRVLNIIFALCLFCLFSCKKDKKQNDTPASTSQDKDSLSSDCKNLPPTPQPFGWTDTTIDVNKNVNAFFVNPLNPDEIVYVVNGDIFGYNKMFTVNLPKKQTIFLASISGYLPQVNQYGWIVFSDLDNNISKIKCNGDSLTQITTNKMTHDPKWDYSGKFIYYYQTAFNNVPSKLNKVNAAGGLFLDLPIELAHTAIFKKSDKIIYLRTKEKTVTLVLKDLAAVTERDLITAPYDSKADPIVFDNLTLDNNDENFYWSNLGGIFKCNLISLKVDTILKGCPNKIYDSPYIIPSNINTMTFTRHELRPVGPSQLFHEFKSFQMNLTTREITETRIFP